jgi:hypothetical protein
VLQASGDRDPKSYPAKVQRMTGRLPPKRQANEVGRNQGRIARVIRATGIPARNPNPVKIL